jgi:hypothetical protein
MKASWYRLFWFQEEWLCLLSWVVLLHLCDVPYPFRHLGGITLFWVVWCLPILSLGDMALVLIFWSPRIHYHYVICHWSDKRWWQQFQGTISRISACWSWHLDSKLLQAFSLAMAFRYWIDVGWVLSWARRALSPSLFLFGNAGLWSKGFMLAINTAGTYPEIQLLYTGSMTPGEICYKVYWLATIDSCVADLLSPLRLWFLYLVYIYTYMHKYK